MSNKNLPKGLFIGARDYYSTYSGGPHGMGLDVHQATISATVLDAEGKLVMEAILETKAETILQFIHGLRGSLHVTFEEGEFLPPLRSKDKLESQHNR